MSEVTLTIGRRSYTVACADGQEAHVRAMGAEVAERLRRLGTNQSSNDAKNVLFAALILADELFEERQRSKAAAVSAPPSADAGAEAEAQITRLEEELSDAREEQERLRQHLVNANERLARAQAARDSGVTTDRLGRQLVQLAETLENSASALERACQTS
jgi:cell division protein ZapA